MGYDMEMEEYHEEREAFEKELEELKKEIMDEAKKVVDNYVENPSDISGSVVNIHENSPFLDSDEKGEPFHSGSRWKKIIRSKKC